MYRKTYMEIDTERLKKNIKKIKTVYKDYKYYFGVVKNNAYGHGIECIKYMKEALKLAKKLGKGKTVVTVLPDTAERYFSTPLFGE